MEMLSCLSVQQEARRAFTEQGALDLEFER